MQKIERKLFFVWNEKKEKEYLEKMALDGYELINVGFGKYTFEKTDSKRLVYEFDFKGLDSMSEEEYLQIFEDAGWKLMSTFGGWYYFAQEVEEDKIDLSIFNNNSSRKEKYKRLLFFLVLTGFPLYYQIFLFYPNLLLDDTNRISGFYAGFRVFVLILSILHFSALVRIFRMYKNIDNDLVE